VVDLLGLVSEASSKLDGELEAAGRGPLPHAKAVFDGAEAGTFETWWWSWKSSSTPVPQSGAGHGVTRLARGRADSGARSAVLLGASARGPSSSSAHRHASFPVLPLPDAAGGGSWA
jgi:hypothetical protein